MQSVVHLVLEAAPELVKAQGLEEVPRVLVARSVAQVALDRESLLPLVRC